MATSSLRSKFEEHLTCSVCLEKLKNPKVLPCLHSFCHDCIVKLARNAKSKSIICPECRKAAQIDDPNNLSNLPSNFFVNNLLATMALTDDQEAKKIVCDNCDSGDVAKTRCEECGMFLCHFCTDSHKRYRATKGHGLASMHELKASAGPASVAEKLRCAKHKEEVIKLYCKTCQVTICRDCTIVDHQGHKYGFIQDVALQEKQKLQANLNEVKQRKVRVQQGIESLRKFDEGLVSKKESVIAGINHHFNELEKVMQTRKRELVQKATALTSSKQKQIHAQIEQLEMALASCESSIEFTEQAFKNGNDTQVLSMQKYILQSLKDLKIVKDQTQPCVTEDMTFAVPLSVKDIKEKVFNSYAVDDAVVSPGNCQASFDEPDAELKIGKQSTITISCYDKNGQRVNHGGQLIKPTISGVEIAGVTDNKDGTHKVTFCTRQGGVFKFQVNINGHPAPCCSLAKDVKWMISNEYGSGEIINEGLTMKGKGWRVGNCTFESGVHTWKVQVRLSQSGYYYNDYQLAEVGVVDFNKINANMIEKKCMFSVPRSGKAIDFTLSLDMEKRSLKCSSKYADTNRGHGGSCLSDETKRLTAQKVSPYFFCPSPEFTLSIIQ